MKAIRSSALLVLCALVMPLEVVGAKPSAQTKPGDLDRFVGDYELVTSDSVTITRREGTLFGQLNSGNPIALTHEEVLRFVATTGAIVTFVVADDGSVSGLLLQLPGRPEVSGKRIRR